MMLHGEHVRSMRIDLASGAGKDGDRRGGGGFGDRYVGLFVNIEYKLKM